MNRQPPEPRLAADTPDDGGLDALLAGSFPASDPPAWPITHAGAPCRQRLGAIPAGRANEARTAP